VFSDPTSVLVGSSAPEVPKYEGALPSAYALARMNNLARGAWLLLPLLMIACGKKGGARREFPTARPSMGDTIEVDIRVDEIDVRTPDQLNAIARHQLILDSDSSGDGLRAYSGHWTIALRLALRLASVPFPSKRDLPLIREVTVP
jgi:hypothetical protein